MGLLILILLPLHQLERLQRSPSAHLPLRLNGPRLGHIQDQFLGLSPTALLMRHSGLALAP